MSAAEFMGLWSGTGIFVSKGSHFPIKMRLMLLRSLYFAVVITVSLIAGCLANSVASWFMSEVLSEFTFLLGNGVLLACLGVYCFGDVGHWRLGQVTAVAPHVVNLGSVRIFDAESACAAGDGLLVDARRELDFRAGAVDGAVNIPVYADRTEISRYLSDIPRSLPVYVYCQSSACDFDEAVGRTLVSLGFQNVATCTEGYNEYINQVE